MVPAPSPPPGPGLGQHGVAAAVAARSGLHASDVGSRYSAAGRGRGGAKGGLKAQGSGRDAGAGFTQAPALGLTARRLAAPAQLVLVWGLAP